MAKQNVVLSGRDAGRVQKMLREWEHRDKGQDHRRRKGNMGGLGVQIFEVQSAATGDGVYNCYRQSLDADDWVDTTGANKFDDVTIEIEGEVSSVIVEVLHLKEYYSANANHVPGLGKFDKIVAWQWVDDAGTLRWVGLSITGSLRSAVATESAQGDNEIVCNLWLNDKSDAGVGELGYNITVYAPTGIALNTHSPKILSGTYYAVYWEDGDWYFVTGFQNWATC